VSDRPDDHREASDASTKATCPARFTDLQFQKATASRCSTNMAHLDAMSCMEMGTIVHLSCRRFCDVDIEVPLQLHALAYNLATFFRCIKLSEKLTEWSLTSQQLRLIKIGARVVRHAHAIPSNWPRWASPARWCAPSLPQSADYERRRDARDRDPS